MTLLPTMRGIRSGAASCPGVSLARSKKKTPRGRRDRDSDQIRSLGLASRPGVGSADGVILGDNRPSADTFGIWFLTIPRISVLEYK